ncbi:MAG: hypothetical protein J1E06_06330 [Acutalibacter sp.]|nr:hypothetical protein [Acutalibacter sp.]
MTKKFVDLLALSIAFMIVLPWAVQAFVKGDAAIGILLLLLYVINPIYSAVLGWFSGKDLQKMWFLPILSALLFLSGGISHLSLWAFAGTYLVIGIVVMFLSDFIRKRMER